MIFNSKKYLFRALNMLLLYVVVLLALSLVVAFPVMWCWNHGATHAFGAPKIEWGHAYCLLVLAGLLLPSYLRTGSGGKE